MKFWILDFGTPFIPICATSFKIYFGTPFAFRNIKELKRKMSVFLVRRGGWWAGGLRGMRQFSYLSKSPGNYIPNQDLYWLKILGFYLAKIRLFYPFLNILFFLSKFMWIWVFFIQRLYLEPVPFTDTLTNIKNIKPHQSNWERKMFKSTIGNFYRHVY